MLANKALSAAPSAVPVYVEDVFSTYLWEGNATARNIVNGIDLAGKGGLVWTKYRNITNNHRLYDTARGATKEIYSSLTNAESTASQSLTAFNADGFSLGTGQPNENTATVVGWTFAQQEKFFDVVTYTGNGTAGRTISHNLGSTPGCIIVKSTSGSDAWIVWHRSANSGTGNAYGQLAATNSFSADNGTFWGSGSYTAPTSTTFTVSDHSAVNGNGATYVAYLFAHDAGGFGASGSDNVITCGSYTGDGTTDGSKLVSLGYEPQWVLVKRTDSSTNGDWHMIDVMRGMPTATSSSSITALLLANSSAAENLDSVGGPKATGFSPVASLTNTNGATYIYIAIRRGPMKTPTSGTSVYNAVLRNGTGTNTAVTGAGFPPDSFWVKRRDSSGGFVQATRLQGLNYLSSNGTSAEQAASPNNYISIDQNGYTTGTGGATNQNPGSPPFATYVNYFFQRAPGFFDVVCYTGTGSATTFSHNLGVAPELMIVKRRSAAEDWSVYSSASGNTKVQFLNTTDAAAANSIYWNNTSPTSSVFTVGTSATVNSSGSTYVAYLFASLTGVSKVGSYTGNGSSQTINCGFTGGARFVLIKRTDSTGDWVVFDSARGIVSGNDPALELNTTDAEVTTIDAVDTDNSGFVVNQETTFNLNVNNATYIFYAVA
jgi:hypothetical protein